MKSPVISEWKRHHLRYLIRQHAVRIDRANDYLTNIRAGVVSEVLYRHLVAEIQKLPLRTGDPNYWSIP